MAGPSPSNPPRALAFRPFNLVAFGASAGGLRPLQDVLGRLPDDFPLPIVVVQHLSATFPSQMPRVLAQHCRLPCRWVEDGDPLMPGGVLVARSGANLVLTEAWRLQYAACAKPRMGWPSVNVFFDSMARVLGPAAVGVILSGMMHDGASGIASLRQGGGATIVQHPRLAAFPEMPSSAIDLGRADLAMTTDGIAQALEILAEWGVL
jgi:two-component system, chemotaxis family, protein-glutamate methylesterase/glutaminase